MSGWFTWFTVVRLGEKTAQHVAILVLVFYLMGYANDIVKYLKLDRVAPEILLRGEEVVQHERGTPYKDAGAVSPDPYARVETVGADFSVDEVGTFTVAYTAVDRSDNRSVTLTRTVQVVDTVAPTIRLEGDPVVYVLTGGDFVDPGASSDDPTATIVTVGDVDVSTPGVYSVAYTAVDPAQNKSETVERAVHVVDLLPSTSTVVYYGALLAVVLAIAYAVRRAQKGRSEASLADV